MQPTETDLTFRKFCAGQVDRLGFFEPFRFLNSAALKEYRKFFEAKTRDTAKVEAVIDEAVKFEHMPTIADLRTIWTGLFPVYDGPVLTDEERQARAEHLRDWYAEEARQAQARRDVFLARSTAIPVKPVTEADIESMRLRQLANQRSSFIEPVELIEPKV